MLSLLATPVLTRLFSPSDFGVFAVFAAIFGLLSVIANLRYNFAISVAKEEGEAANLLLVSLIAAGAVCFLTGMAVLLFGEPLAIRLDWNLPYPYLYLLPVGILFFGMYQGLQYWSIRYGRFGRIARTRLAQSVGMVGAQIGGGLVLNGPIGLFVGHVIGQAAGISTLALIAWRADRKAFKAISLNGIARAAWRHIRFPLISGPGGLINSAGWLIAPILVATIYGPEVAGYVAISFRVLNAPVATLSTSVGSVYLGSAPKLLREAPARLYQLLRKVLLFTFCVGLPTVGVLALGGPWLFTRIFGADWGVSGTYAQLLAPMFLARLVVNPLTQTLIVLNRQGVQLAWEIGRLAVTVTCFVLGGLMKWPPPLTLIAFSGAVTCSYVFLMALNIYYLRQYIAAAEAMTPVPKEIDC